MAVAEPPVYRAGTYGTESYTNCFMIGAKVVRHGRYITFQLAEVAIPRRLFAEILRLIAILSMEIAFENAGTVWE